MTSTSTRKAPPPKPTPPGEVKIPRSGSSTSFDPFIFDQEIRDSGYRMLWSSAEMCPCASNSQTEQADPNCEVCNGSGFVYLLPNALRLNDYDCTCPGFEDTATAKATQAIVTSQTNDPQIFERFGEWLFGSARLTTFSWNDIGYKDRFEHVDSEITYRQRLAVPDNGVFPVGRRVEKEMRYKAQKLLRVFRISGNSVIDLTATSTLTVDGGVDVSKANTTKGDRVSISYRCHPIWLVTEFAYAPRDSRQHKNTTDVLIGKHDKLPVHSFVKLDFLA